MTARERSCDVFHDVLRFDRATLGDVGVGRNNRGSGLIAGPRETGKVGMPRVVESSPGQTVGDRPATWRDHFAYRQRQQRIDPVITQPLQS